MEYFETITNANTGEVTIRPYNDAEIEVVKAARGPSIRRNRDNLLTETDWCATSDRTMSAEQTAYRQALRDITAQAGFPNEVVWPTKPE